MLLVFILRWPLILKLRSTVHGISLEGWLILGCMSMLWSGFLLRVHQFIVLRRCSSLPWHPRAFRLLSLVGIVQAIVISWALLSRTQDHLLVVQQLGLQIHMLVLLCYLVVGVTFQPIIDLLRVIAAKLGALLPLESLLIFILTSWQELHLQLLFFIFSI